MQETEAKFYLNDPKKIEARLQSLEAHLIQDRVFETNIRFDLPDASLRSEGCVLRLRQDTKARLTYKSASTNEQGVLSRREIEFTVEDFEIAREFIEALGYQKLLYYEKFRTTYTLDPFESMEPSKGSIHIMLDELPYGNFVEIEGHTIKSIQATAKELNLNWDATIATSYHALFERLCANHPDLDRTDLSFAALKGRNITAVDLFVHAADG